MLCLCAASHSVYHAGEHLGDFSQQLGHGEPEIFYTHLSKELRESVVRCSPHRGTNPLCVLLFLVLTKGWGDQCKLHLQWQWSILQWKRFLDLFKVLIKTLTLAYCFVLNLWTDFSIFVWFYPCFTLGTSLGQTTLVWDSQHQLACDWVKTQIGKRVRPTDPAWLQPQQFKPSFLSQLCTLLWVQNTKIKTDIIQP